MARFFGKVGYGLQTEIADGVWSDSITEVDYFGDVLNQTRTLVSSDQVNDNFRISDQISIVADAYALQNYSKIKYVVRDGVAWKADTVQVQQPRLVITLGGVYDGPRPGGTDPGDPTP